MLTQKPFTTWCVVGLSLLHGEKKHHILPSMSHYNNLRLSENICIFLGDHPSGPYSLGAFTFHNTEWLPYTRIQAKGCYLFVITLCPTLWFYWGTGETGTFLGRRSWHCGFQQWAQVNANSCLWLLCNHWFACKLVKHHKAWNKSQQVTSTFQILRSSEHQQLQILINCDLKLFYAIAVYNRPPTCLTGLAWRFTCCIHAAQGTELGYIIMPSLPSPSL